MIYSQRLLHLLILLLAMHIPAGASKAQDAVGAGPVCSGETGSGCWREIANLPGCHVWNPRPQEEETVTWSGSCMDGRPSGMGQITWRFKKDGQSKTATHEGPYVDGKEHGHWVERFADGTVQEGPYVDGEKHGHWVLRSADGGVQEGPFVDGKKHGHWVERWADGQVEEGQYVDGEKHGHWVLRSADGTVRSVEY